MAVRDKFESSAVRLLQFQWEDQFAHVMTTTAA